MKKVKLLAAYTLAMVPVFAFSQTTEENVEASNPVVQVTDQVGASMTPADKYQQRVEEDRMNQEDVDKTPKERAIENSKKFPSECHRNAYYSLSEKNRQAYDALDEKDQDKVVETYRNGGNHQRTLTNSLNKDQKTYERNMQSSNPPSYRHDKDMEDSPATRAMKRQQQAENKQKESNVFN